MLLHQMQLGLSSNIRPSRSSCLAACRRAGPIQSRQTRLRRCTAVRVTASAAAAAVPGPDAVQKSSWASLMQWWDVGQSENDKNRQPGKLSDTLKMAWQLIAQEKKLMGVASFLMVRTSLAWLSCSAAIKACKAQSHVFSTHSKRAERAADVTGAAAPCKSSRV